MVRQRNISSSPLLMVLPQHVSVIRPSSGGILIQLILSVCYSLSARDQISHQYETTSKMYFNLYVLGSRQEDKITFKRMVKGVPRI
jgi:hypothetical protein